MDSYRQTSTGYSSSCVESPLSVNSHRGRPADYSHNGSSFGPTQHDGCQNPENSRENGKHNYAMGGDIREEGQRQAFVGILDVYVHHARDIHNICIYDKQDVYAKLSLTSKPEGAFSTQISNGGGRNPVFNESLQLKINSHVDTSLKCEVWMLSRAKNYLEDQLLGFALVPLASVVGKGKVTQDFALSSTDLFHSLAGIVQLTLSYQGSVPSDYHSQTIAEANLALSSSDISSEAVLLGHGMENSESNSYNDIEFPDLQIASENNQMVSEYIKMASDDLKPDNSLKIADPNESEFCGASFSQLGTFASTEGDYEMAPNVTDEKCADSLTVTAKVDNSYDYGTDPDAENSSFHVGSSTTSSSSEGQCPRDFSIQKGGSGLESSRFLGIENASNGTSLNGIGHSLSKENLPSKDSVKGVAASSSQPKVSEEGMAMPAMPYTNPLVSINLEPEQTVVQQQIVDMYMKSMQQFTESLAKMKLPMDIENKGSDDSAKSGSDQKNVQSGRNGGSRVFYGSRAFF
ncbi:hypothetical protein SUGI_0956360 [Cryptomeria japonica]|uniref:uncharacterized protein LOC131062896 n=1 Tax=Cryptomeria japonica TaxID=3369 RepID=UPI0024147034|nr:uncharacterized protein LOC131062896 [Cryptomeria japonica]XP_059066912.1 uncharacterized protein LOC131062896 [Cryptomeria japonica]GLJ45426.1 hypothetical protein SUGI_0956360 [Cryptomeria japonica]